MTLPLVTTVIPVFNRSAMLRQAVGAPDTSEELRIQGVTPQLFSSDQFRDKLKSEIDQWAPVIAKSGMKGALYASTAGLALTHTVAKAVWSGLFTSRKPFLRTPGALEGEPWKDFAKSFIAGGSR